MTKTTNSGAASQTGLSGAMDDVVYTADDDYYFPEGYNVTAVNGISVTRNSYTQITVSGTPTADAEITLTAPTAKTTPSAPTEAAAVDCTTTANNNGKLTGVSTAMEYKKSDAEDWTSGTGSDITGLVPGTYYIRYKATDTALASDNQTLTIAGYSASAYSVTLSGGANATAAPDAGVSQTVTQGQAMTTVTYTAGTGYEFPANSEYYKTTDGITVSRTSDTVVTVSGTPAADVSIMVPDAVAKTAISYIVTFKVANGSWDDGSKNEKTVTLTGYEGDELKLTHRTLQ
ncbi:MAG: hypothetical protein K6G83_03260 [Lachnospiraceae bacterium]|nr:hypothetical protein [Lachnospiraceae bacterium]